MDLIRVIVADDHPLFRKGIAGVLDREPDIEVVGEASEGHEAIALASMFQPDVIVMDLQLPDIDGCDAIAIISAKGVKSQFLVLTAFARDEDIFRAFDAGVRGYLLKESEAAEVIKAVRAIGQGESYVDTMVGGRLLDEYGRLTRSRAVTSGLSAREIEVLQILATGASNQAICDQLHIGMSTVKTHVAHILKKLDASNRREAVEIARERGLIRV